MATKSATRKGVLNARQIRFVEEYLVDMNATQAAIRAGYSKRTAAEQGYDLLRHPHIGPAIEAKRQELSHKTGITVERVLAEMARIAFADTRKLYDDKGALLHPSMWDDDTAAAVAGVDVTEEFSGSGEERELSGYTRKVKLWDKGRELAGLLKHLGAEGGKDPTPAPGVVMGATPGLDALLAKLASTIRVKESA